MEILIEVMKFILMMIIGYTVGGLLYLGYYRIRSIFQYLRMEKSVEKLWDTVFEIDDVNKRNHVIDKIETKVKEIVHDDSIKADDMMDILHNEMHNAMRDWRMNNE